MLPSHAATISSIINSVRLEAMYNPLHQHPLYYPSGIGAKFGGQNDHLVTPWHIPVFLRSGAPLRGGGKCARAEHVFLQNRVLGVDFNQRYVVGPEIGEVLEYPSGVGRAQ